MFRTMIGVLASVLLVGSLGVVPSLAGHDATKPPFNEFHEAMPTNADSFVPVPESVCVMTGAVHFDDQNGTGGISADEFNHNHYTFLTGSMDCTSTVNDLNGVFDVEADGGTDGGLGVGAHGESRATGWSHSSNYDDGSIANKDSTAAASCDSKKSVTNKGDIWVENNSNNKEASGWVKFIREGTDVEAWGCLSPHDGAADILFQAQLVVLEQCDEIGTKVKNATVTGTATVGRQ